MANDGYIQDYPCKCSGGEMCFIVRHPNVSPDPSYETREEAEEVLQQIRDGKLTTKMLYPNLPNLRD